MSTFLIGAISVAITVGLVWLGNKGFQPLRLIPVPVRAGRPRRGRAQHRAR